MLYEKHISANGKVSYREYNPETLPDMQIESDELIAVFSGIAISMLLSLSEQLPEHSKVAREAQRFTEAIARFGRTTGNKLDENMMAIGVKAWQASVLAVQVGLLEQRGKA